MRGVKHYMQRTALQGSPEVLSKIIGQYLPGAAQLPAEVHPFRKRMAELEIGTTLKTASRARHARRHRAFRSFHRRHLLRPYGRRGRQGVARSSAAGSPTAI